jgi:hypothetical protein
MIPADSRTSKSTIARLRIAVSFQDLPDGVSVFIGLPGRCRQ